MFNILDLTSEENYHFHSFGAWNYNTCYDSSKFGTWKLYL